jgi:hypothetical protein
MDGKDLKFDDNEPNSNTLKFSISIQIRAHSHLTYEKLHRIQVHIRKILSIITNSAFKAHNEPLLKTTCILFLQYTVLAIIEQAPHPIIQSSSIH